MLTPSEIIDVAYGIGAKKVSMTHNNKLRLWVASIMAGSFITLGGAFSLIGASGFAATGNLSLTRLISGLLFPVGLTLIVTMGGELFTGNNALLIPAFMKKHYSFRDVITNWTSVYIGNFIGIIVSCWLLVYLSGILSTEPFYQYSMAVAQSKVDQPWFDVFLRGIGANWCVCLAIWLALSSKSFPAKALGCWIPVVTFVVLGYEHCIANMFYLGIGVMNGAPVTIGDCLWRNILPSTIGNIIGGALFVGTLHTWLHAVPSSSGDR